jgi:hypothetical protein
MADGFLTVRDIEVLSAIAVFWLVIGVFLTFIIISPTPTNEENTTYVFTSTSEIDKMIGSKFMGLFSADGCASRNIDVNGNYDGTYTVMIDSGFPKDLQKFVLRHENCHVKYYKLGINNSEDKCYIEMWKIW